MKRESLQNRINNLERTIDSELSKYKSSSFWIAPILKEDNENNICIFNRCPKGSEGSNKIWHNVLEIENGQICYFKQCPKGSKEVGNDINGLKACSYKQCPDGSRPFK